MTGTNKREFIVSTWRQSGEPPVGKRELRQIQRVLAKAFGEAVVASPALIARLLADEGAELCHPEVIECDARWRESKIEAQETKFRSLETLNSNAPLSLTQAEALIGEFEELRKGFERGDDEEGLAVLQALAGDARRTAERTAKDNSANKADRIEQSEIAEWLKIWMQTPSLFADWVDLRKRSEEFKRRFR